MKNCDIAGVFKIFLCCVGTVIGAGFASGQEIMSFFVNYNIYGAIGIIISGILFFAYIYVVLKKIYICNIDEFSAYFQNIAGKTVSDIIQIISYGFMFASFCVMVSGSGAVAEHLFNAKSPGIYFMAILCFFVFSKGCDGMVIVNAVMTPLITIGILIVGLYALLTADVPTFSNGTLSVVTDNFFISALVYVSYNTVTLIGVLLPLKDKIKSKKTPLYSGLLSGGVLCVMGIILWGTMYIFKNELTEVDVPMLYISSKVGFLMEWIYAGVLYMAMITTAVSSGYALLMFVKRYIRIKESILSAILCAISVPMAYIGFADLVNKLYRFFGFLGMFVLVLVLFDGIKIKNLQKPLTKA